MTQRFDEMHDDAGAPRPHYRVFDEWLRNTSEPVIRNKRHEAEIAFHRVGITFSVYGEESGNERLIPFDMVPRIVPAAEWRMLEAGLRQRVHALNLFLGDVYGEQRILHDGRVPADLVLNNAEFRREMCDLRVPGGVYSHISGIDLVRAGDGEYYVLEDNLRVPSGVSYMLENRRMMARLIPELFARQQIAPVERYPDALLSTLREAAPEGIDDPVVAVLTPGSANSAYFEHAFLAQQMGVELVEGADLFVRDDTVYARTTRGPQRVHVIYRRINDDYLDPTVFRAESMLGVPGLFGAYRAGRVTLANAPGTGVHVLDVARADHPAVAHGVLVLEGAAEHVRDDLHVAVRVHSEAHAGHDEVVVDHAQTAVAHPALVVVVGEAEGVVGVEPAVVGVASFVGAADRGHAASMPQPGGFRERPCFLSQHARKACCWHGTAASPVFRGGGGGGERDTRGAASPRFPAGAEPAGARPRGRAWH